MREFTPGTVLVVEDQALVRLLAVDALESMGYEILEAEDGNAALSIVACRQHIDVLFTDISLPGDMDGVRLAEQIDRSRPEMGIVVTSGIGETRPRGLLDRWAWLPKPYRPHNLAAAIASAITANRPLLA